MEISPCPIRFLGLRTYAVSSSVELTVKGCRAHSSVPVKDGGLSREAGHPEEQGMRSLSAGPISLPAKSRDTCALWRLASSWLPCWPPTLLKQVCFLSTCPQNRWSLPKTSVLALTHSELPSLLRLCCTWLFVPLGSCCMKGKQAIAFVPLTTQWSGKYLCPSQGTVVRQFPILTFLFLQKCLDLFLSSPCC